jgi:hypothetical protein
MRATQLDTLFGFEWIFDMATPSAFGKTFPLEAKLCAHLKNMSANQASKLSVSAGGGLDPTVRCTFLRWFLLEALPSATTPITHLEIERASFAEILNLEATTLNLLLRFVECEFKEKIELSDATLIGFDMVGGTAREIMGDRLNVKGSMRLRRERPMRNAPRLAMLRLCGADIRGNLDMRGCVLRQNDTVPAEAVAALHEEISANKVQSPSLFADGLKVHGSVLLSDGFKSFDEVRLNGSNIGRNLDCSGATLVNPGGYSLSAAGAHIFGSAYFSETQEWITYPDNRPFSSHGTLRLEGATIDGDLVCSAGHFLAGPFLSSRPDPGKLSDENLEAIAASCLKVGSDIFLDENFEAKGVINLISAHIGGDLLSDSASFSFAGEEASLQIVWSLRALLSSPA